MLCCALVCVSAGQWVMMGVSDTVCADFVNRVIYSLSVSCQRSVMSATKPTNVYSVRRWKCLFSVVYFGGKSTNIVLGPSFCMAMFVKCVWMCELVLGDGVESNVSACGVVLILLGFGWCASM